MKARSMSVSAAPYELNTAQLWRRQSVEMPDWQDALGPICRAAERTTGSKWWTEERRKEGLPRGRNVGDAPNAYMWTHNASIHCP